MGGQVVSQAIHILCARIGGAHKGKGEGENMYGVKGQVFVHRRNAIPSNVA